MLSSISLDASKYHLTRLGCHEHEPGLFDKKQMDSSKIWVRITKLTCEDTNFYKYGNLDGVAKKCIDYKCILVSLIFMDEIKGLQSWSN